MSESQMMHSRPADWHALAPGVSHLRQKSDSSHAVMQMAALVIGGPRSSLLHYFKRLSGRPTQTSACLP